MLELKGQTALITGGAKRLGKATAMALAQVGMNIVVHYNHSRQDALSLVSKLRAMGVDSVAIEADLSSEPMVKGLIPRAVELAGPIHALINNASIFAPSRLQSFTRAELEQNVQVNAFAPLVLSREFDRCKESKTIINFLDSRIGDYDKEHAAYHLSKRMLFSSTRMLALELAPKIRVNAVAPGLILPPPGEGPEYLKRQQHTIPLQMHGNPTDIAETVRFLMSSEFVTGQVIFVDGGRHMKTAVYG